MAAAEPVFDDLYREVVLDHYRKPRNKGRLADATSTAQGMNPVCGDEVTIDLRVRDGVVEAAAFTGLGCSISLSSASMLTEQVTGKSIDEAKQVIGAFKQMLKDGREPAEDIGDLVALEGVSQFPARVKCALLCWNVLEEALGLGKAPAPRQESRN